MGSIDYALTAAANFLQQLIVAEVAEDACPPRDGLDAVNWPRTFFSIWSADIIRAAGVDDPGYNIVIDQPKAGS
jgi:hypothetical protein